ncbi:MAG: superoxide dismutase family protein [Proteobacteria bacterium]|nr:superoxide dismutase family protein [Pseudomonadota bacterium]
MQVNYFSKSLIQITIIAIATSLVWGCSAVSVLAPISGQKGNGTVRFYDSGGFLKVQVYLSNLVPHSVHNLRIYEVGDCRDPLAGSTGKLFKPSNYNLGLIDTNKPQFGDLGDVVADENGTAESHFTLLGAKLTGPRNNSILGRSLLLTFKVEGSSSNRVIACGLISKNSTL